MKENVYTESLLLLIAPQGIEIIATGVSSCHSGILLIAPQGIEIGYGAGIDGISRLLIAPQGIEIIKVVTAYWILTTF